MSAPKNPVVVDDVADDVVEAAATDAIETVEPAVDDLDVPEPSDDAGAEADAADPGDARRSRRRGRVVAGAVGALVVAAAAVWGAGSLGGSDEGLATTVTDPAVVLTALQDGGIACTGAVVSGDVATCNATVAVRVFASSEEANAWIKELLRDPMTSSAFGWVQHGNAVVSAPLNAAPDVATALGPEAVVY